MASPCDVLDDVPDHKFGSATLELDPASTNPSRTASPCLAEARPAHRPSPPAHLPTPSARPVLKPAYSDPLSGLDPPYTPPTPEECGLGFYTEEGLSRSFYQQPPIGSSRRYSWHSAPPLPPHPLLQFFSVRTGAASRAVVQCRSLTDALLDGDMRGAWVLTQVHHWGLEQERLVLLCDLSLLICKYDFIALRPLRYTRLPLRGLSEAVVGELVYPARSLVPVLTGLAGGVVSALGNVFPSRLLTALQAFSSSVSPRDEDDVKMDPLDDPTSYLWQSKHSTRSQPAESSASTLNQSSTLNPSFTSTLNQSPNSTLNPSSTSTSTLNKSPNSTLNQSATHNPSVESSNSYPTSSPSQVTSSGSHPPSRGVGDPSLDPCTVECTSLPANSATQERASVSSGPSSFLTSSRGLPGLRLFTQPTVKTKTGGDTATMFRDSASNVEKEDHNGGQDQDGDDGKKQHGGRKQDGDDYVKHDCENQQGGKQDFGRNQDGGENQHGRKQDGGENQHGRKQDGGRGDDYGATWRQRWNPFCSDLPYHTLTSHPLYWQTEGEDEATYDILDLAVHLSAALDDLAARPDTATMCVLRVAPKFRTSAALKKPSDHNEQTLNGRLLHGGIPPSLRGNFRGDCDYKRPSHGHDCAHKLPPDDDNPTLNCANRSPKSTKISAGSPAKQPKIDDDRPEGVGITLESADDSGKISAAQFDEEDMKFYKKDIKLDQNTSKFRDKDAKLNNKSVKFGDEDVNFDHNTAKRDEKDVKLDQNTTKLDEKDTKLDEDKDDDYQLVVENYVGLVSMLHNATQLGYFKMRGKISF